MRHPTESSSTHIRQHLRWILLFAVTVTALSSIGNAQVRRGPPEGTPAYEKHLERDAARAGVAADVKAGRSSAADLARAIGAPGAGNPLGLETDKEVAETAADIGRRLKTSRDRGAAREFFATCVAANDRALRAKGRLNEEERLQLLLEQARLLRLELGRAEEAKVYLTEVTKIAPDDERGHVLYDHLSSRFVELFPPVRRYPFAAR